MNKQVAKPIKDERVKLLRTLSQTKKEEFYQHHIGTTQLVLVERQNKKSKLLQGFTENYLSVQFEGPVKLAGTVVKVKIDHLHGGELFAIMDHSPLEIID